MPKKKLVLILFVVISVVVAMLVARPKNSGEASVSSIKSQPTPTQTVHSPSPSLTVNHRVEQGSVPPSQQQIEFVNTVLMPLLQETVRSYPIAEIRERIARFLLRVQDGGDIKLQLNPLPDSFALASMHKDPSGQKILTFWVSLLMGFYEESGQNFFELQDQLVLTLLHEMYHAEHHLDANTPRIQGESEAWWYSIEYGYLPMRRIGRMTRTTPITLSAVKAYEAANGNPTSQVWLDFIRAYHH